MYEGFREDFLSANANKEIICAQFTEVVRDLLRAVGSTGYPHQAVDRAAAQMGFVLELLQRADNPPSFGEMFARAAEDLGQIEVNGERQTLMIEAAQVGVSLVAEWSCLDNAAGARRSKREREFLQAMKNITEAQAALRKKFQEELRGKQRR